MLWILLLSTLMAGAVYLVHGAIDLDHRPWRISSAAIAHGSALLALFFAVKAWSYALDRFLLLYNDNGIVVGAGYTDVHVELPVLWLLICLAAAAIPPNSPPETIFLPVERAPRRGRAALRAGPKNAAKGTSARRRAPTSDAMMPRAAACPQAGAAAAKIT